MLSGEARLDCWAVLSKNGRLARASDSRRSRALNLRLKLKICFACLRIHGNGNMLLNDQPLSPAFSINIGDAHRHVVQPAGFRFREMMLEAVAVGQVSVDIERKVLNLE